jgi:hypothetical protein
MNLYRVTLRRLRHEHAIPNVMVVLPVRAPYSSTAYEVSKSSPCAKRSSWPLSSGANPFKEKIK